LIIATAGHVDHGKTSLVRNLTGVETDRLEEEQRRGLSISLGYAYWRLDSETVLGFIDVPGHHRFINNMISGISGIDLGMLVVAADDGPMPQTREHLQVMSLLGVKDYLAVVSKGDRVDEQRLEKVCKDTAALLPLNTPIYKVSNTTGAGIDELRTELEGRARGWTAQAAAGHFRMSVDRAFNLQGRGLILTGTISSGSVANGDTVVLQPQRKVLRVRSIHAQDTPAEIAQAGERCALNISGDIHKDEIERGDWVASESCIGTTSRFDARIRLLPEAAFALKHLTDVKLHIGAKRLEARLILLKSEGSSPARIHPGESALAQFVTERPILCCHGDRFLLRDYGETATLGGGTVLEPQGLKTRKSSRSRLAFLDAMQHDDIDDAVRLALNDDGCILEYGALLKSWNVDSGDRPGSSLPGVSRIDTDQGELWLAQSRWAGLKQRILDTLPELHRSKPAEPGVKPAQLMRTALPADEHGFFQPAISELTDAGDIKLKDGLLAVRGHQATPSSKEDRDWPVISACLQKHGRKIPGITQLEQECGIAKLALQSSLDRAQRDRRLIKISPKRYALTSVMNEFARAALELTQDKPTLTVVEYRDHLGCGRNTAIEVLEYFDGIGFTRRDGEARIIRDRKLPDRLINS
jgi:selenocysteine-specific elongation factor